MAVTHMSVLHGQKVEDVDLDATVESLVSSSKILHGFEIDNTQNSEDVYLKMWGDYSSHAVGTDPPDFIFKVDGGAVRRCGITEDEVSGSSNAMAAGFSYSQTNLYVACVTTPGTAGTTSPTNSVNGMFFLAN